MTADIFVFASQKGGSGKTTLSGHVAVQAHLAGAGPVGVIDTDPQHSLMQWHGARKDNSLILRASTVEDIEGNVRALEALGARTIIIDTPPAATTAIGIPVGKADLVCIPVRPSPHDLRAVGATIEIVEAQRRPMVFVLNGATVRARLNADAIMALSQHGTVAPMIIHNRMDFVTSMAAGRTAMEVNQASRASAEIQALWTYATDRLRKLNEQQLNEQRTSNCALPHSDEASTSVVPFLDFRARSYTLSAQDFFRRHSGVHRRWSDRSLDRPQADNLPDEVKMPVRVVDRRAS